MSPETYAAIIFVFVVIATIVVVALRVVPMRLKQHKYQEQWQQLQNLLKDSAQWSQAIIIADDMLDEALKKRKVKGSTMGERLVNAQKRFTNNDAVWFGHKMRTRLDDNPAMKLKKEDVQKALLGLRQGLKDMGAM
jgi:phage terminase small subunit